MGSNRLHAVKSLPVQALRHMLKAEAWPLSRDAPTWRADAIDFRRQARRRFVPSMRQKIDVTGLHADALAAIYILYVPLARTVWVHPACRSCSDQVGLTWVPRQVCRSYRRRLDPSTTYRPANLPEGRRLSFREPFGRRQRAPLSALTRLQKQ